MDDFKEEGDKFYEELDPNEEDEDTLREAAEDENSFTIEASKFFEKYPEHELKKFNEGSGGKISMTEYAPKLFRNIRKEFVSEQLMFESFKPASNF